MAMPQLAPRFTVADVLAMPDDGLRRELIGGRLIVSPGPRPRHQELVVRLIVVIQAYLARSAPECRLVASPADISWDAETLVQPDLFVVPALQATNDWSTYRDLLLAVEVSSPSSRRTDRVEKRQLYQARGVATYWIVDHEAAVVEVWRVGDARPEIVTDVLTWRATAESPELAVPLEELFAGLPG